MAIVLNEWLAKTLQRPIKWEAEEFGDVMKNGHAIAGVLQSYHVINDEKYYLIRESNNIEDIKSNWKYLKEWLLEIDISINETELMNLMNGKGSSLLRLFYQLFLHLDKRDRTNFIIRERKMVSSLVEKMGHRFNVEKIIEHTEPSGDSLSKPLLNERHMIEWQKKKAKEVKDTYDYLRHKYSKLIAKVEESKTPIQYIPKNLEKLEKKENQYMEKFAIKYPTNFLNYTYEELLKLEEKALERKKSLVGTEWSNEYLNNLYGRMQKKSDSEEFQKQLGNSLDNSLWEMSVNEEESNLDMELAKKVLKLSQFEKQMCTQIMETKQQARNLVNNRIHGEKEFAEQREQQLNNFYDNLKQQIDSGAAEIDFETKRQNMLHKRLYAEKMKRKRQHYYSICYETVLSLVDYSVKFGYFKILIGDIPNHFIHEWKTLFFKQQPIFDIIDPLDEILWARGEDQESSSILEEITRLELDRQEILSDSEINEYHEHLHGWRLNLLLPNYDPDSEDRKIEYLGSHILGHVIYTLLEVKYPYPPSLSPAALPDFSAKAILRGLPDKSITLPMQTLLNLCKIHIVRLESVINFCIKKYKSEMLGHADIDISFDKFLSLAQEEENKELIKSMKVEEDNLNKNDELNTLLTTPPIIPNTKQTQTPKVIPEEDMTFSVAADLGKYAYEAFSVGDSLTDYLIAAMIVEYLKNQDNIEGFVIINYPNSYLQAQVLEEVFSGICPPDEVVLDQRDDVYLEESIIKHQKKENDPYKEIRISKISSNPHKKADEKPFETYFTCYINLKETDDILRENFIWDLTEDNSELIDRFYAILGINYSIYYEIIDKELLAQICKFILGDFSLPLKSCDTLFGENVLDLLDFPSSDDKRLKCKVVKSDVLDTKSKDKLRRSSKIEKSKSAVVSELEIIKAPYSLSEIPNEHIKTLESIISQEIKRKSINSLEEIKILAGDDDWVYAQLPIPESIGLALATYWEQVEKSYIQDIQQLFLAKRLQFHCLVPYARFLKDKMDQIITMPSNKQDLVNEFQKQYNDFNDDWRNINLTKNEWHCRVKELQNKLYKICDDRKINAQQQRRALISDNWIIEELTTLANTYISCMQTELNRSVITFQIFHDFYFTLIKGNLPNERLSSKDLTRILRDNDNSAINKKGAGDDKLFRQLKTIFQEMYVRDVRLDYGNNPFNMILEANVKFAIKFIKDINDSYRALISKEYNEISKIVPSLKKKDENDSMISISPEEIFKQNALKCIDEWSMGINGEMFRLNLCMSVLQNKCYHDMKLFYDQISKAFMEIQDYINSYYENEIKAVDRLCKYFQMCIEKAIKIPETLILEYDTFVIDPNLLQFTPCEPSIKDLSLKAEDYLRFNIGQLAYLRSQFKLVAPTGIALHKAFIYLLQDFVIFGKEAHDGSIVPIAMKSMDAEQVPKLVFSIFGETAYIDWKDFLIYCLEIRFPSTDELLELRKIYRCHDLDSKEVISRDNYMMEKLWFEEDNDFKNGHGQLRLNLIKHFLFELYEVSQNLMNYSAFLLAFCKSINPIEGFVKALSLAVGKKVCFSQPECGEVVNKLIEEKIYKDECLACAYKCAEQFVKELIKKVLNSCDTTIVEEVEYTSLIDVKGKKGKSSTTKSKKVEVRSAIIKKSSTLSRTKVTKPNNNDIICPPCQKTPEIIDIDPCHVENIIEEKLDSIIQPDPNLAYAVSQSVIWNVLQICLPWHFQLLPDIGDSLYAKHVEDAMKLLETDTDNKDVYICKFVSEQEICKLLHKVRKFTAINLVEEIRKVM